MCTDDSRTENGAGALLDNIDLARHNAWYPSTPESTRQERVDLRTFPGIFAAVGVSVTLLVHSALAQAGAFRPRVAEAPASVGNKPGILISINDHPILTLPRRGGGDERAHVVAERLRATTAASATWTIEASPNPGVGWMLTVNGLLITTVTNSDAADHRTTVEDLAKTWARALQSALAEAPIEVPGGVVVPTNETRSVPVTGYVRAADIAIRVDDTDIATARFDAKSRRLIIQGKMAGRATITLASSADGVLQVPLPIVVSDYAAVIKKPTTVMVTGRPTTKAMVQQALWDGLSKVVNADVSARLDLPPNMGAAAATGTYDLQLRATGPGLLPASGKARVTIAKTDIPDGGDLNLLYSNDPETIKRGGELLMGRIFRDIPIRLDFHHQNVGAQPLGFQVSLMNVSDAAAAVHVLSGIATPAVDTIQVGRRAGAEFLNALDTDAGIVVEVPPHSMVPVVTQRLPAGYTVSGIVQMRIASGDVPIYVRVNADDSNPWIGSPIWNACERSLGNAWRLTPILALPANVGTLTRKLSGQIYPQPRIVRTADYVAGGKWAFIEMGRADDLVSLDGASKLSGNYGADYDIAIKMSNPTDAPRIVGIYFYPEAGLAAGVFRIDNGDIIEFNPTDETQQLLIARYTLAAAESKTVHLRTIPLNGGFYPAAVVVRPL